MTAPIGCLDEREVAALVEELDNASGRLTQYTNNPLDGLLNAAARMIESLVEDRLRSASRQEGWISVDARMPPPITYVIAHGRRYGDREGHKRVYVTYTGTRVFETVEDEEIAYWMPLPAAPQQSQEAQGDRHGE